jgi:predicted ester cyclase
MTAAPPADVLAAGDSGPRPDDYRSECEMVLDFIQQVWNDRDLEKVTQFMPRDLFLNDIGYRTWIRPEGYRRALLKLLRPFPSGQFQIRDVQTNYSVDYAGLRIAVCWVLVGDYDGQADFGPLTGQRTDLLGVSQFLVQNGKIMRETRIYDEIALRAQINAGRGDEPVPFTNIY